MSANKPRFRRAAAGLLAAVLGVFAVNASANAAYPEKTGTHRGWFCPRRHDGRSGSYHGKRADRRLGSDVCG